MKTILALIAALLLSPLSSLHAAESEARKPNVIFILVDDLGWGDLGCYGNLDIATPSLDRMAEEGMLFEQFYVNGSMCSPSRAAMLTGRFPAEVGIHYWMSPGHNKRMGMPEALDPELENLPRTMQRAGYRTGHFGKWHVGQDKEVPVTAYGYDETDIVWQGTGPNPGIRINSPEGTGSLVDRSIAFGERCEAEDRPFFITCWPFDVHAPLDPTEESLAKYDHFRSGRTRSTAMQIYYAAVTALDAQIGRLLDWIDADPARAANTLVIFTSDNGPEAAEIPHAGYHAAGSTGPFRGRKRSLYEGGVRLPFIARWKDHIPAGTVDSTSVISGVDLLPTLAKLAGAEVPADAGIDGEDVSGILLTGESRKRTKPLLWEWRFEGVGPLLDRSPMLAIRDGDWKLLFNPDGSRVELYDIPRQPMELHSQAEAHPDVVARLRETALAWQATLPDGPRTENPGSLDYPGYHEAPGRGPLLDRAKYETLLQPVRVRLMRDEKNGKASNAPAAAAAASNTAPAPAPTDAGLFQKPNLAAWCIVPFDGKKRGPEERAAMLKDIGITKFVYDYRPEHIPQWDEEMMALKKHGIELLGWYFPTVFNDRARETLELFQRHGVKPQLWVSGGGREAIEAENAADQQARIAREVERLQPICEAAAEHGLTVGLYNHGGWFGEPENQIAILEALKTRGITNAGIVYNLHHGHGHLDRFPQLLEAMKPHLLCFNLNGMDIEGDKKGRKILPLGVGTEDVKVLRQIRASGYSGPVGILNHTDEDAEGRLLDNLDGLNWLVPQLDDAPPAAKPKYRTWSEAKPKTPSPAPVAASKAEPVPSLSEEFGMALSGGLLVDGKGEYHTLPFTIECRAKLDSKDRFNILVACNPKSASTHWELYTHAGRGTLALYLPGRGGDYDSGVNICDGQWHNLVASVSEEMVTLWVDGKIVLEKPTAPAGPVRHANVESLAFGRLVEGTIGCDGIIDDVRLSRGVMKPRPGNAPRLRMDNTLGLWSFDDLGSDAPTIKVPEPAPFTPDLPPFSKADNEHWQEFVNRERVFDYYGKQALAFMKQKPLPELIPAFPGMDGGQQGHWGNQNDQVTWRDGRWAASDLGSLFCGVFKGGGITVPKGICVRFDDKAAVFDPERMAWRLEWTGGFLKLNENRHGFMAGAPMDGQIISKEEKKLAGTYRGLFRQGKEVTIITSETPLPAPAAAQWPQWLETKGDLGTQTPFATDRLTIPFDNPYGTLFFITAHDFFSDGTAAIATMTGEVWLVKGIDEKLETLRWKRFATGLHQPLGVKVVNDQLHVLGRDQITRLHDLNGDDEADFYECVTNIMQTSPGGHDFIVGLETDTEGRWLFASGNQGICRVSNVGQTFLSASGSAPEKQTGMSAPPSLEVLATGFRNPNGLGISPDGRFITTSVQEGDWTPATSICQIELGKNEGAHFGAGGPKDGGTPEPVLMYLPRGEDNSGSSQAFITGEPWAALKGDGNLVHLSSGGGSAWLVMRQNVKGLWQGAAVRITGNFDSGPQAARFNPNDGHLYVNGMQGWGSYTPKDGAFQRVRFTGGGKPVPIAFEARDNGVLVRFNEPVGEVDASTTFAQCWNYLYSAAYGSPEYSVRYADTPGHDPLEVRSVQKLEGGKTLFIEIPQLIPASQVHLHLGTGHDIFLTAHRLDEAFTNFPGYTQITKTNHAAQIGMTAPVASKPNPWAGGESGRAIVVEAALGLQFVQKTLKAKAGERLTLVFKNPDVVPHNWILGKPGTLQSLGDKCNLMITDPKGLAKHYVPESDEVLVYTDMVNAKGEFTIHFDAPAEPGDYPYLCTFPGHWMIMNGVMTVE